MCGVVEFSIFYANNEQRLQAVDVLKVIINQQVMWRE